MKKDGFTLIELMAILVILSVILLVAVPAISKTLKNSSIKEFERFKDDLLLAAKAYVETNTNVCPDRKTVPACYISIQELINQGYIDSVVIDPDTKEPVSTSNTIVVTGTTARTYTYTGSKEGNYVKDHMVLWFDAKHHSTGDTKVWQDLSGNGITGTLTDVTFQGNYAIFNGNTSGVSLGSQLSTLFQGPNTIEMVVSFDDASAVDILIGNYNGANNINWERTAQSQGRFWFNNGSLDGKTANNFYPNNQVYTVSHVFDKMQNKSYFYKNGTLGHTLTSTLFSSYNASYQNVWIGRDMNTGATALKGKIYSIRVYDKVLSAAELQQNYEVDKERYGI